MNDVVMFISYMTLHTFALFFLCVLLVLAVISPISHTAHPNLLRLHKLVLFLIIRDIQFSMV